MPRDGCYPERDNSCVSRCRVAIVVGERLEISRVRVDLTQAELGVLAELGEKSASACISSCEEGVHVPDFRLVCRLAAALDVPKAYFYAVGDKPTELILQCRRLRKNNPDCMLLFSPNP